MTKTCYFVFSEKKSPYTSVIFNWDPENVKTKNNKRSR